ncbi:MAG: hypothetical protein IKW60_02725 [Clostridia bacterium]|nr:hypothetical protein [Clostridia bacterium]
MIPFIAGVSFTFSTIINLAIYIAIGFSLYRIARNHHLSYAWIAFIPIVQFALIGVMCEEYLLWDIRLRPLWLLMIVLILLDNIYINGILGIALSLAVSLLTALIYHKFFYLFEPQRAMIYAALSLLGSLPIAIILFLIKDKLMCMSAAAYPYPFPHRK